MWNKKRSNFLAFEKRAYRCLKLIYVYAWRLHRGLITSKRLDLSAKATLRLHPPIRLETKIRKSYLFERAEYEWTYAMVVRVVMRLLLAF